VSSKRADQSPSVEFGMQCMQGKPTGLPAEWVLW
jgi:hypothetical protein